MIKKLQMAQLDLKLIMKLLLKKKLLILTKK